MDYLRAREERLLAKLAEVREAIAEESEAEAKRKVAKAAVERERERKHRAKEQAKRDRAKRARERKEEAEAKAKAKVQAKRDRERKRRHDQAAKARAEKAARTRQIRSRWRPIVEAVASSASEHYGTRITVDAIRGRVRTDVLLSARYAAIWIAVERCAMSQAEAAVASGRTATSVRTRMERPMLMAEAAIIRGALLRLAEQPMDSTG